MSKRKLASRAAGGRPGAGKPERYMQPCILMALRRKPSYGYELIQEIPHFGFMEGPAPPGMIYRHLRDLEGDGLVVSEWEAEGSGPAKRVYRLTGDGEAVLALWVEFMQRQAGHLMAFVDLYRRG
jgi:poly-beta-hydroxybutyrate-responsive repressor